MYALFAGEVENQGEELCYSGRATLRRCGSTSSWVAGRNQGRASEVAEKVKKEKIKDLSY
jgi:hypothetical protein